MTQNIKAKEGMVTDHLAENLRLLCSYGRSTSDVCRRVGINRQQFSKYLNGHSRPSLSTLRRLCDFFGVDEHEVLQDAAEFRQLVRLRAPQLGERKNALQEAVNGLIQPARMNQRLMEAHAGYYQTYNYPEPSRDYYYRSLTRIYQKDGAWLAKSIDRNLDQEYVLPSMLKYSGLVFEANNRIVVCEREQFLGYAVFQTILYASDQAVPTYLSGLMMSVAAEAAHEISCVRVVWHYLGQNPCLREALKMCGSVDRAKESIPDIVVKCTDNRLLDNEDVLSPRT